MFTTQPLAAPTVTLNPLGSCPVEEPIYLQTTKTIDRAVLTVYTADGKKADVKNSIFDVFQRLHCIYINKTKLPEGGRFNVSAYSQKDCVEHLDGYVVTLRSLNEFLFTK